VSRTVLLQSARDPLGRSVVLEEDEWVHLRTLAAVAGGSPLNLDDVIPPIDAFQLAKALRRGLDSLSPASRRAERNEKVRRVLALLEKGSGVVVTRTAKV
jgi:hypothetical protein